MAVSHYFLGANSAGGFYSLYDELIDRETAQTVFLLKGGPGCGKSTLMRRVGQQAEQAGLTVEYIRCSGDPDSLDGLVLPQLGAAIADATAPHVLEPLCPGAVDRYVDLGQHYDTAALHPLRPDILDCMAQNKKAYRQGYHCLKAAAELGTDIREFLLTEEIKAKLEKRARGIISREIRSCGLTDSKSTRRFLSGLTCQGAITLWETIISGYPRVYELCDSYGAAHSLLVPIAEAAAAHRQPAILCPNPLCPDRLEHLLLPALGLAFVTSTPASPYPGRAYRRLHLDALLSSREVYRKNRARIRFSRKMALSLLNEGLDALAEAKTIHDRLESIYHPHVNFAAVQAQADLLSAELLGQAVTANP